MLGTNPGSLFCVIFRRRRTNDSLKMAIVSWHWRLGLFCCWPQFGGRAGMINVVVISSPWATVDATAENYGVVDTEKDWEVKTGRRVGVVLWPRLARAFFRSKPSRLSQTDCQENLTPRRSRSLCLSDHRRHWTSNPDWTTGSRAMALRWVSP